MNHEQRIWEVLLAVHSLDELDGSVRDDVEEKLRDSEPLREAWERLHAFDHDVMHMLTRVEVPQDFGSRVESLLAQVRFGQEIDGVHEADELTAVALSREQLTLWKAARRFDDQVVDVLEQVDVPEGLQVQLLRQLAAASISTEPAADDAVVDRVDKDSSLGRDARSESSPMWRRRWMWGVAALAVGLLVMVMPYVIEPVTPSESLESLASTSVKVLDGELSWTENKEHLEWSMPERAEFPLDGGTATVFRLKRAGRDVYLVRLKHPLAVTIQQRYPYRFVPTSGGWHVGVWSDGTFVFLACSRDRSAIELFQANIQAI
jgi:hypothetical protein